MKYKSHRKYTEEEVPHLLAFCGGLPEKARRHFLALQYKQLGQGSQRYLAEIFQCSRITITEGLRELESGESSVFDYGRERKAGGGRKKKRQQM
jgi:hypothetical protein